MNEAILVVDDDAEIVRAIAILLEKEGYRVLKAYNGLQALDLAMDPSLRLILMDVMMPKLDGLSAVLKIREQRNLPILILSAKGEDTDKILGLSMGADDYIAKPFHPQELVARVRSHLRRYTQLGDVNAPSQKAELVTGRLCYLPDQKTLLAILAQGVFHRGHDAVGRQRRAGGRIHIGALVFHNRCGHLLQRRIADAGRVAVAEHIHRGNLAALHRHAHPDFTAEAVSGALINAVGQPFGEGCGAGQAQGENRQQQLPYQGHTI